VVRYTEKQLEELKTIIYKTFSEENGYMFKESDINYSYNEIVFSNLSPESDKLWDEEVLINVYLNDLFKRLRNKEEKVEPNDVDIEFPLSDLEIVVEWDFEYLPMAINTTSPLSKKIMKWRLDNGI